MVLVVKYSNYLTAVLANQYLVDSSKFHLYEFLFEFE